MDIHSVNSTANSPVAPATAVASEKAAENRSIVKAVTALNAAEMFGQDNLLTYHRDPESKRMVIQIVNQSTHEVVSQIPPEYLLRLAEDMKTSTDTALAATAG
jgi:uncharacterized FlaG/YvyC family protein